MRLKLTIPCSIMHFALAIHSFIAAGKARGLGKHYCANCREALTSLPGSPQVAGPSQQPCRDRKAGESGTANNEGETEGDRLIVPALEEA